MTTLSLTRTDVRVRDAVVQELEWDSLVDASAIGVSAKDGAVALTGLIDSYAGKLAAERAAKRVRGVRAVANDVEVRLRLEQTDADIAGDAARALSLRVTIPQEVQAAVHHGHVTLTGSVSSLLQRAIAEKAIHELKGLKGIVNRIEIAGTASPHDIQREIVRALHRDATLDARRIRTTVAGHTVRLDGTVRLWHELEAAERAAGHAAGIAVVDNRLSVAAEALPDEPDDLC